MPGETISPGVFNSSLADRLLHLHLKIIGSQVLPGVATGVQVAVMVAVAVSVAVGVGVAVGIAVAVAVGIAVTEGVGVGVAARCGQSRSSTLPAVTLKPVREKAGT